jgi:hypothetical protein
MDIKHSLNVSKPHSHIGTNEEHTVNLKLHITLFDCTDGRAAQTGAVPIELHPTEPGPIPQQSRSARATVALSAWRDA